MFKSHVSRRVHTHLQIVTIEDICCLISNGPELSVWAQAADCGCKWAPAITDASVKWSHYTSRRLNVVFVFDITCEHYQPSKESHTLTLTLRRHRAAAASPQPGPQVIFSEIIHVYTAPLRVISVTSLSFTVVPRTTGKQSQSIVKHSCSGKKEYLKYRKAFCTESGQQLGDIWITQNTPINHAAVVRRK